MASKRVTTQQLTPFEVGQVKAHVEHGLSASAISKKVCKAVCCDFALRVTAKLKIARAEKGNTGWLPIGSFMSTFLVYTDCLLPVGSFTPSSWELYIYPSGVPVPASSSSTPLKKKWVFCLPSFWCCCCWCCGCWWFAVARKSPQCPGLPLETL